MLRLQASGLVRLTPEEIADFSTKRAIELEACCWSPRVKVSDEDYHSIIQRKTAELCGALCREYGVPQLPNIALPAMFADRPSPASVAQKKGEESAQNWTKETEKEIIWTQNSGDCGFSAFFLEV
jgi:hypothetical protein